MTDSTAVNITFNPYNAEILVYQPLRQKCVLNLKNGLVSSFPFSRISMLWVYGHYKYLFLLIRGTTSDARI